TNTRTRSFEQRGLVVMPESTNPQPFSRRQGLQPVPSGPPVWNDAPETLRVRLLYILTVRLGLSWSQLRDLVCAVLDRLPDANNWSEPNIKGEVQDLIANAPWFKIFDVIEA